jgi:hypothetical protein
MKSSVYLFLVASLAAPHVASSQDTSVIRGTVVDAQTLEPIPHAFVGLLGSQSGVLADSVGTFSIVLDPSPTYRLRVSQIGYSDYQFEITRDQAVSEVILPLPPNPLEIEGLTVLADRLANRRVGPYGVADVLDRVQLINSTEESGYHFLLRVLPFVERCGPESDALCLMGRTAMGEKRQVQVCLDDRRVPGDYLESMLAGVDPRGLYLVEVFDRAGEVRMYSPGYIKRLVKEGGSLPPLSFGCRG